MFDYNNYKNILVSMKKIGKIYTFESIKHTCTSGFILRHDVDFDIEKAYKMFLIEKELNVKSTYFILTTSDLYNINSKENRKMLKDMHESGFEIGLHFDPTIYGDISLKEMSESVKREVAIIENIINDSVKSISLHNPSIHNQYPEFKGYKNAYSTEFFNKEYYISDSCKDFRGKDIYKFIEKGKENILQVLFHPIHFSENEETYITSFNKIIEEKIEKFDNSMIVNKTYKRELGNKKVIDLFLEYIKGR